MVWRINQRKCSQGELFSRKDGSQICKIRNQKGDFSINCSVSSEGENKDEGEEEKTQNRITKDREDIILFMETYGHEDQIEENGKRNQTDGESAFDDDG